MCLENITKNMLRSFVLTLMCLITIISFETVSSAKILGLFTTPFKSQLVVETFLMKTLASKGHNVTVVTTFPEYNINSENYRSIVVPNMESDAEFNRYRSKIFHSAETNGYLLFDIPDFVESMLKRSNHTLQSRQMQKLLASRSFDLVIIGWMANDFELGVAAHFKCPSIVLGTMQAVKPLRDLVGNPSDLTHISSFYLAYVGHSMTFFQRIKNSAVSLLEHISLSTINYFKQEKYYRENFPSSKGYESMDELKRNVSLVLVNHHFSQGNIRSHVPGLIEIGGFHLNEISEPLNERIKIFLDGAVHGAIILSFGSYLQATDMTLTKQRTILNVFSKLQQRILLKWNGPVGEMPENVLAIDWLPQQHDILAHKNVRLLITHGGVNNLIEARYYGVPILGIPIYGDQQANINLIVDEGTGIEVPYTNLDETGLSNAIETLLNSPTYSERALQLAGIFRDRPIPPLDLAVYWVEYVIQYRGAKHLQSPAARMGVVTFYSLDVIGAAIFLLIRLYITYKGVRYAYGKFQSWRAKRQEKVKKE